MPEVGFQASSVPPAGDEWRLALRRLVVQCTAVTAPALCPELKLRLITPDSELFRASEEQVAALGLVDPWWAFCWPGGQALARYVLDHAELVRGRSVLDFGAGSGVAGLAAARSGARVTAADIDPVATIATELNAELNGVSVETTTRDFVGTECRWDVVLLGDVTYEARFSRRLLRWAEKLARDGALVVLGDPGRGHLDRKRLREVAKYEMKSEDEPGARLVKTGVYMPRNAFEDGSPFQ